MKPHSKRKANTNPKSKVFVTQFSHVNVSLNYSGQPSDEFHSYGEAYHRAGLALFRTQFSRRMSHDSDILPIAFMLRHAAELYLKAIVRRGNSLFGLNGKSPVQVRHTHKLTVLLDDVRPIFDFMEWSWDAEKNGFRSFSDFRKCIADLERDEVLGTDDSQADMWRYPVRRKDDEAHLPVHFNFDVQEFVTRLDILLRMLSGAAIGLDMVRDDQLEAMAYADNEDHDDHYDYEPPDYEPPDYE